MNNLCKFHRVTKYLGCLMMNSFSNLSSGLEEKNRNYREKESGEGGLEGKGKKVEEMGS